MTLKVQYQTADNPFELYDYKSTQRSSSKVLFTNKTTLLYRNNQNGQLQKDTSNKQFQQNIVVILNIQKINNRYAIANSQNGQDLCLVVGSADHQENSHAKPLPLKVGSMIKIGRSKILIEKINLNYQKRSCFKTFYQSQTISSVQQKDRIYQCFYSDSTRASMIDQAPFCRYCYQKSINSQNLLRILCKCEGSAKYVHDKCLKEWIKQKSKFEQTMKGIFRAQKQALKCQICKQNLPLEQVLPCFGENYKQEQYLIASLQIEGLKTTIIIFLKQKEDMEIIIGRKDDCHISVLDATVSREHCKIKWSHTNGTLILEDLGSKFGTLLRKNGLQILEPTQMQRGKTKFVFQIDNNLNIIQQKFKNFISNLKK